MDDVVLMTETPQEKQQLLDKTDHIVKEYHIEFVEEKSLCLTIGRKKRQQPAPIPPRKHDNQTYKEIQIPR